MGLFDKLRRKPETDIADVPEPEVATEAAAPATPVAAPSVADTAYLQHLSDIRPDGELPGWDAIVAAFERLYPEQTDPWVVAPDVARADGGDDPLEAVAIYGASEPVPHWHYVGMGMTELYDVEQASEVEVTEGVAYSGYGVELTFRLADPAAGPEGTPPTWPVRMMQALARVVFDSGTVYVVGDRVNTKRPLHGESALVGVSFAADPELPPLETPSGRVEFLQVVGITRDELRDLGAWGDPAYLEIMRQHVPGLVTDLGRPELASIPAAEAAIQDAIAAGGDAGELFVEGMEIDFDEQDVILTLPQPVVEMVGRTIGLRTPYGKELQLMSPDATVAFLPVDWPSDVSAALLAPGEGEIHLTGEQAASVVEHVKPEEGIYTVPGVVGLVWRVVPGSQDADAPLAEPAGSALIPPLATPNARGF